MSILWQEAVLEAFRETTLRGPHLHGGDGADPTWDRQRNYRSGLLNHVRRHHVGLGHRNRLKRQNVAKGALEKRLRRRKMEQDEMSHI